MRNIVAVSSVLLSLSLAALAQTPPKAAPARLNHQGRLLDAAGTGVTGAHTLTFSIYADPIGGSPLWTETQAINFDAGYYSTVLGAIEPLTPEIFSGRIAYVSIAVDNAAELAPREPIVSVPYAMVSTNAIGDITPNSVSVGGTRVIDSSGKWVGPSTGLKGDKGDPGVKGDKGDTGAPGAVNYELVIRNDTAVQPANFNISGNGVIGGGLSLGLTLRGPGGGPITCANFSDGVTDCSCGPGENVLSGGGELEGGILRISRPFNLTTWRVGCMNTNHVPTTCSMVTIVCSRLAP